MSTETGLGSVPLEITTEILKYLKHNKEDLMSLSLVSKKLHSLTSLALYETVVLDLDYFNDFDFEESYDGFRYISLLRKGHQNLHLIKNFGVKGNLGVEVKPDKAKKMVSRSFNWIVLSIMRRLGTGQLRNFIWNTELDITKPLANELQCRQKLQGIWVSNSGAQALGFISKVLFQAISTSYHLKNLHFDGINEPDSLLTLLADLETLHGPRNLQSLTIGVANSEVIEETELWIKDSDTSSLSLQNDDDDSMQAVPRCPYLEYLSLNGVDNDFLAKLNNPLKIEEFFDINKLQTLKLLNTKDISSTLESLRTLPVKIKTFHVSGKSSIRPIEAFLASFTGLKELYIDMKPTKLSLVHGYIGLKNHTSTLVRLFVRLRTKNDDENFGDIFRDLVRAGKRFPQLLELAISCPPPDLEELRIDCDDHLPKLQFLWLLSDAKTWKEDDVKLDNLIRLIRPLLRYDNYYHNRWPFVAVGDRSVEQWPFVFELCETFSITGYIGTSLSYVPHRYLFNHNPDLVLLNIDRAWLPWQEE
ncbi:hypothetical protein AOL_s00076g437 [Orbilia oligospora ATCC 24927]|uniref:F-box domain-containing protein n=1 Tax=Arthrobotrys oligospora (strain ATCC 24927 / CBS 115.81 / DSM 1491) TaxID=756982 RepID=G1X9U8_ARTOA|nr:hypothetical protein AOL_s00076g437 [Orbilia oligospora ATCC 24927]EGX50086.1 hypothetical protein AOL_s00076g437 [Orbilia oligospora ATCC 24927]